MQQLVIRDGKVIATHPTNVRITPGMYQGDCAVITYDGIVTYDEFGNPPDDPRSPEEKRQAYKDRRRLAYPQVEDQLDMLYHDTIDGTTTWVDAISKVKQQHPKG